MADRSGKREETRQRLVEAAYVLFERHGYDNVTVDQIAARAGVSRRTFFRHFKSKDSIVFPFTDARLALYRAAVRAQTGGRPATFDDLRIVYRQVVQSWVDNTEDMLRSRRIVAQSPALRAVDYEVNAKWERTIALEIDGPAVADKGLNQTPSLRARVMAGILTGAIRAVFENWYESGGELSLLALGERALDVAAHGLETMTDDFAD